MTEFKQGEGVRYIGAPTDRHPEFGIVHQAQNGFGCVTVRFEPNQLVSLPAAELSHRVRS